MKCTSERGQGENVGGGGGGGGGTAPCGEALSGCGECGGE